MNFKLAEAFVELKSRGFGSISSQISSMGSRMSRLASGPMAMMTTGLAAMGATAGITGMLKMAADAEKTSVAFNVLTGSAAKGQKTLDELRQFAASTPFQFPELADAAKKLIAFGFESGEVTPELKKLGDVAAGLNIPIGELAEIYGKARVSGRLFMEDINQLAGRGIPIQAELAKQFGVSADEVRELVSSGQVNFGHLQRAIADLTGEGGKFAGLMEAQSNTLGGLWSTLSDNVGLQLTEIGTMIVDTFDLKAAVRSTIAGIQAMKEPFSQYLQMAKFTWDNGALLAAIAWEKIKIGFWNGVESLRAGFMFIVDLQMWQIENLITGFQSLPSFVSAVAEDIVAYGSWFTENWYEFFVDMANGTRTVLENLATNIQNIFTEVWDFIASGGTNGIDINWKPLMSGFEATMAELPKSKSLEMASNGIRDRLSELPEFQANFASSSPELDRLQNQLNENAVAAFGAAKQQADEEAGEGSEDAAGSAAAKAGKEAGKASNAALVLGSSGAANVLARALGGFAGSPEEQTEKNTKRTADELVKVRELLKKNPLLVVGR